MRGRMHEFKAKIIHLKKYIQRLFFKIFIKIIFYVLKTIFTNNGFEK